MACLGPDSLRACYFIQCEPNKELDRFRSNPGNNLTYFDERGELV